MRKNKEILKIVLMVLIAVFLMLAAAGALVLIRNQDRQEAKAKADTLELLDSMEILSPTPAAATPTPTPVPTATPTPTPVITPHPAFSPDDYWGSWYGTNGLVGLYIYDIGLDSVSFSYSQANSVEGNKVSEADVSAEVIGNAAQFSFYDSWGNGASGTMIFDNGQLYVKISTFEDAGVAVRPEVDCIMLRERPQASQPQETVPEPPAASGAQGDYFFADSNSRYLTDEELSGYSSSDLELAKNEIYARHGRQFVTQRIADYFNGKSWYQGNVDPETFDAMADSVFNEYEMENIRRIEAWENQKRSQGQ